MTMELSAIVEEILPACEDGVVKKEVGKDQTNSPGSKKERYSYVSEDSSENNTTPKPSHNSFRGHLYFGVGPSLPNPYSLRQALGPLEEYDDTTDSISEHLACSSYLTPSRRSITPISSLLLPISNQPSSPRRHIKRNSTGSMATVQSPQLRSMVSMDAMYPQHRPRSAVSLSPPLSDSRHVSWSSVVSSFRSPTPELRIRNVSASTSNTLTTPTLLYEHILPVTPMLGRPVSPSTPRQHPTNQTTGRMRISSVGIGGEEEEESDPCATPRQRTRVVSSTETDEGEIVGIVPNVDATVRAAPGVVGLGEGWAGGPAAKPKNKTQWFRSLSNGQVEHSHDPLALWTPPQKSQEPKRSVWGRSRGLFGASMPLLSQPDPIIKSDFHPTVKVGPVKTLRGLLSKSKVDLTLPPAKDKASHHQRDSGKRLFGRFSKSAVDITRLSTSPLTSDKMKDIPNKHISPGSNNHGRLSFSSGPRPPWRQTSTQVRPATVAIMNPVSASRPLQPGSTESTPPGIQDDSPALESHSSSSTIHLRTPKVEEVNRQRPSFQAERKKNNDVNPRVRGWGYGHVLSNGFRRLSNLGGSHSTTPVSVAKTEPLTPVTFPTQPIRGLWEENLSSPNSSEETTSPISDGPKLIPPYDTQIPKLAPRFIFPAPSTIPKIKPTPAPLFSRLKSALRPHHTSRRPSVAAITEDCEISLPIPSSLKVTSESNTRQSSETRRLSESTVRFAPSPKTKTTTIKTDSAPRHSTSSIDSRGRRSFESSSTSMGEFGNVSHLTNRHTLGNPISVIERDTSRHKPYPSVTHSSSVTWRKRLSKLPEADEEIDQPELIQSLSNVQSEVHVDTEEYKRHSTSMLDLFKPIRKLGSLNSLRKQTSLDNLSNWEYPASNSSFPLSNSMPLLDFPLPPERMSLELDLGQSGLGLDDILAAGSNPIYTNPPYTPTPGQNPTFSFCPPIDPEPPTELVPGTNDHENCEIHMEAETNTNATMITNTDTGMKSITLKTNISKGKYGSHRLPPLIPVPPLTMTTLVVPPSSSSPSFSNELDSGKGDINLISKESSSESYKTTLGYHTPPLTPKIEISKEAIGVVTEVDKDMTKRPISSTLSGSESDRSGLSFYEYEDAIVSSVTDESVKVGMARMVKLTPSKTTNDD
ncbi:hypothetical protein M231_00795 [Tremella mesenterica]|uniref:Uncharacterized protein n=1 Tax=Tremella mesenterica TaxID=5217 RepID=A0A4Q1BV91_TREME|nr:hypothetical protein M231_00795 [Tremella mesenterica]